MSRQQRALEEMVSAQYAAMEAAQAELQEEGTMDNEEVSFVAKRKANIGHAVENVAIGRLNRQLAKIMSGELKKKFPFFGSAEGQHVLGVVAPFVALVAVEVAPDKVPHLDKVEYYSEVAFEQALTSGGEAILSGLLDTYGPMLKKMSDTIASAKLVRSVQED